MVGVLDPGPVLRTQYYVVPDVTHSTVSVNGPTTRKSSLFQAPPMVVSVILG